ncbi:MAG: YfcE family phosphodiesterase [Acidobacteria bacterium 21-70-11]|nr:MAG: YfcE family phosphodiesterase [Acidobacteria bacterium 21-70-11]HQU33925.1 metallophosphoesterase family protein [Thermoanaerobaculaceae bacterium]
MSPLAEDVRRPEGGEHRVGVIADTHGLLRPQAVAALAGCELIVHAGDVGSPAILGELRRVAPVVAVRGNVDVEGWARGLPETAVAEVGAVRLYVLHDLARLDLDPGAAGLAAVISGHSHISAVVERGGVLYVNPGSAGPRRFALPASVALLRIRGGAVSADLVALET